MVDRDVLELGDVVSSGVVVPRVVSPSPSASSFSSADIVASAYGSLPRDVAGVLGRRLDGFVRACHGRSSFTKVNDVRLFVEEYWKGEHVVRMRGREYFCSLDSECSSLVRFDPATPQSVFLATERYVVHPYEKMFIDGKREKILREPFSKLDGVLPLSLDSITGGVDPSRKHRLLFWFERILVYEQPEPVLAGIGRVECGRWCVVCGE